MKVLRILNDKIDMDSNKKQRLEMDNALNDIIDYGIRHNRKRIEERYESFIKRASKQDME